MKVTAEMVEAGAEVVANHFYDVINQGSGSARVCAVEVFQAMFAKYHADRRLAEIERIENSIASDAA